jgi:hypothetical protein
MNARKSIGAMVAAFLVLVATNWVVHGVLLRSSYEALAVTFRPVGMIHARMWLVLVGQALFAIAFVYVYLRGLERKPWLAQGARYGVVIWLMTVIPASLAEYVTLFIPHQLALHWMLLGLAQLVITGIVVAAIVGEPAATA